jgi:hypothetical protein
MQRADATASRSAPLVYMLRVSNKVPPVPTRYTLQQHLFCISTNQFPVIFTLTSACQLRACSARTGPGFYVTRGFTKRSQFPYGPAPVIAVHFINNSMQQSPSCRVPQVVNNFTQDMLLLSTRPSKASLHPRQK